MRPTSTLIAVSMGIAGLAVGCESDGYESRRGSADGLADRSVLWHAEEEARPARGEVTDSYGPKVDVDSIAVPGGDVDYIDPTGNRDTTVIMKGDMSELADDEVDFEQGESPALDPTPLRPLAVDPQESTAAPEPVAIPDLDD